MGIGCIKIDYYDITKIILHDITKINLSDTSKVIDTILHRYI